MELTDGLSNWKGTPREAAETETELSTATQRGLASTGLSAQCQEGASAVAAAEVRNQARSKSAGARELPRKIMEVRGIWYRIRLKSRGNQRKGGQISNRIRTEDGSTPPQEPPSSKETESPIVLYASDYYVRPAHGPNLLGLVMANFMPVYSISRIREVFEDVKKTLVSQVKGEHYGVAEGYAQHLLDAVREVGQLYDPHLLQPGRPPVLSHPDTRVRETLRGM